MGNNNILVKFQLSVNKSYCISHWYDVDYRSVKELSARIYVTLICRQEKFAALEHVEFLSLDVLPFVHLYEHPNLKG